jgi:phytoene synthase
MNTPEALAACEAAVRHADPDRYFSGLFVPAERRSLLYVLYAFHQEIVRVQTAAREPMIREIRLEWWREAVLGAQGRQPRAHPTVIGLAEVVARTDIAPEPLLAIIDAYSRAWSEGLGSDVAALEAHARATSAALMRIAAGLISAQSVPDDAVGAAGVAFALVGMARDLPRVSHDAAAIINAAKRHFALAHGLRFGAALPVVMPAALVALYLKAIARGSDPRQVPLFRRQAVFLRCAFTGRL